MRSDFYDEEELEPRVLRPVYHNRAIDEYKDDEGVGDGSNFGDFYDGGLTHMVRDNDYSLRSYIDELEDLNDAGDNMEYIKRIPKRKQQPK